MLLTRIRVGRSLLKTHSHSIGLSDTNTCTCNDTTPESPIHYITQCPRYMGARQTLYDQVEQNFIPNFRKLSLKKQLDILIFGYEPFNPEMRSINNKIMTLTQQYIFKTKRFEQVIWGSSIQSNCLFTCLVNCHTVFPLHDCNNWCTSVVLVDHGPWIMVVVLPRELDH